MCGLGLRPSDGVWWRGPIKQTPKAGAVAAIVAPFWRSLVEGWQRWFFLCGARCVLLGNWMVWGGLQGGCGLWQFVEGM